MTWTSRIDQIARQLDDRIQEGVKELAEEIVADAKDRVPVASGALKNAIHTEPADDGDGVLIVAGDRHAFYGHIVEHGGANHPARPFLTPAAEGKRASFAVRVIAKIRSLL